MAKKFIINKDRLITGHVEYHRELLSDHTDTVGGGWWEYNKEKNIMYLYSKSLEFGQAKQEDVAKAIQTGYLSPRLNDTKFFHSYENSLGKAMDDPNGVWIEIPEENKV
jgi:hypothetical protein